MLAVQVPGQAHSFIEHIQEGIGQAERDPTALLLFSGGQTRKAAGPRSEAEGYWLVAEAASWWGADHVRERAFTEVRCPVALIAPQHIPSCLRQAHAHLAPLFKAFSMSTVPQTRSSVAPSGKSTKV